AGAGPGVAGTATGVVIGSQNWTVDLTGLAPNVAAAVVFQTTNGFQVIRCPAAVAGGVTSCRGTTAGVALQHSALRVFASNQIVAEGAVSGAVTGPAATPTATLPPGVTPTPTPPRVYVANAGTNSVAVLDTASNTVVATIPVGFQPFGVAVHPSGARVYVTNSGLVGPLGHTVSVIHTAARTVVGEVAVGLSPAGVAVNPAGTRVYVANFADDTISVIDAASNQVTGTVRLPAGTGPVGVALKPDGSRVYVTNLA